MMSLENVRVREESAKTSMYPAKDRRAINFYVAASDRDILSKVSDILRGQGYVGIADTSGEIHYIVDGRKNLYASVHHMQRIAEASQSYGMDAVDIDETLLRETIEAVLYRHRIPQNLKGYQLLRYILLIAAKDETIIRPISKVLYPKTAEHFSLTINQVDRIIRYATKQAGIEDGNASLITRLRDEIVRVYLKKSNI